MYTPQCWGQETSRQLFKVRNCPDNADLPRPMPENSASYALSSLESPRVRREQETSFAALLEIHPTIEAAPDNLRAPRTSSRHAPLPAPDSRHRRSGFAARHRTEGGRVFLRLGIPQTQR